jgi:hypothetical protein
MFQVYGIGQALIPVLPPPLLFHNAPTSNQTNYEIGQVVYTGTPGSYTFYIYAGAGVWELLDISTGALDTLTTDDSTVVVPTAGNINLKGAGSTTTVGSGSNATVELTGLTNHAVLVGAGTTTITKLAVGTTGQVLTAATAADPAFAALGTNSGLTAHGVIIGEGTSALAATSAGTAGQLLVSGGASADPTWTTATFPTTVGSAGTILRSNGTGWVASTDTYPDTVVAGDILIATATNVVGSLADVAVGQLLTSGGVGVAPAYTASPSVTGSVTAGTTITATSGAITASNGNFVGSTSGTGILLTSPNGSGIASGPVVVNGRSGRVTFTSVSIAAAADLTLTLTNSSITASSTIVLLSMSGATTGAALSIKSQTASSGSLAIVVTNGTGATTSTADIQIEFLVVNA